MKKILSAVSEAVPFVKMGRLADVVGSLPKCFDKEYFDIRVIIPKYLRIKQEWCDKMGYISHFYIDYLGQNRYVSILQYVYEGIIFYFIDNESYFNKAKSYGDWYWDLEKLCFFYRAALSALPVVGFRPDVMYCHDWQTGLIPVLLKDKPHEGEFFYNMKPVITVHSLKFQSVWDVKTIKRSTELPDCYFTPDKLEAYKDGNLLKGGVVYADVVTTVSSIYTEEIKLPFYGEGLDGLMHSRTESLRGIINGINYGGFNPETNTYIAQTCNAKNFHKEKVKDEKAFQQGLDLPVDGRTFIVDIVSRLTDQKDFDLVRRIMNELHNDDLQLAVLGTGEEHYESMFRHYDWKYHDRVLTQVYYSEAAFHEIYTASDTFPMPSLFEPCGLSQLMALRYGAALTVRETDGLKDTMKPYNEYENMGTGLSFANYNAHGVLGSVRCVKYAYSNERQEWSKIIDRATVRDYSWWISAVRYQELYD